MIIETTNSYQNKPCLSNCPFPSRTVSTVDPKQILARSRRLKRRPRPKSHRPSVPSISNPTVELLEGRRLDNRRDQGPFRPESSVLGGAKRTYSVLMPEIGLFGSVGFPLLPRLEAERVRVCV